MIAKSVKMWNLFGWNRLDEGPKNWTTKRSP
jgi:hypothetical protein